MLLKACLEVTWVYSGTSGTGYSSLISRSGMAIEGV